MARLPGPAEALPVARATTGIVRAPNDPVAFQMARSGAQLTQAGNELYVAFEQETQRVNKTRTEDAITQLRARQIDLSAGDDGFTKLRGGDAVKRPILKEWGGKFDQAVSEISQKLDNEEQRQAFKRAADVVRNQYNSDILGHVAREDAVHQKNVMLSTKDVEQQVAGQHWNSPGDVMASLERAKAATAEYAKSNGIDGVVLEALQNETAAGIHSAVINEALVNNNPGYAKLWFKTHRKEIDEQTAIRLQAAIDEGDLRATAQKKTDEIVAQYQGKEALSKAREIKDPELRDEVVRRVSARHNETEALKNQSEQDAYNSALKIVVNDGGRDDIPPSLWNSMSGTGQKAIKDYLTQPKDRTEDDWTVLASVQRMIEAGDVTEPEQLLAYRPYFRRETYQTLLKTIDKRDTISAPDVAKAFQDRIGMTRGKILDDTKAREQFLSFQDYIYDHVKESKRPEDLGVWADRWFMEGYTKEDRWGRDPKTLGAAVTQGRTDFLIKAPDEERNNVTQSIGVLEKSGFKVQKGKVAIDEFYTKYYLDAVRYLSAHDSEAHPTLIAAYAYLKQAGQPITSANLNYVAEQLNAN